MKAIGGVNILALGWGFIVSPSPAVAQKLATGAGLQIPFARIAAGLLICCLIAFAAGLLMKAAKQRPQPAQRSLSWLASWVPLPPGQSHIASDLAVRILETRRLSQHGDICAVSVGEEIIILAITQGAILELKRMANSPSLPLAPSANDHLTHNGAAVELGA